MGINDPSQCRFVLDIPLAQCGMPQKIWFVDFHLSPLMLSASSSSLDDGLTIGWSQTQRDLPFEKRKVSSDNLAVRSWGLAHQAGTFTYPHHDADGDVTYVMVMSGVKLWTLYFYSDPTLARDRLFEVRYNLCDPDTPPSDDVCAETVYLYPGDLLYAFLFFFEHLYLTGYTVSNLLRRFTRFIPPWPRLPPAVTFTATMHAISQNSAALWTSDAMVN